MLGIGLWSCFARLRTGPQVARLAEQQRGILGLSLPRYPVGKEVPVYNLDFNRVKPAKLLNAVRAYKVDLI